MLDEKFQVNDTLNPKIWSGNKLKPEVKDKLLEIVEEFKDYVDIEGLKILDAHIVGSNASYNYTDHSDLDLHLIVNFDSLDGSEDIVQALFNSEKKSFNKDYDIDIKGVNIEVYVEDVRSNTMSNGIYSLFEDKWIKEPQRIDVELDDEAIDERVSELTTDIEIALLANDSEIIQNMIDRLYMIRKNGLSVDGEYSIDNQVFKEIRNLGLLDELKDRLHEVRSRELSLENFRKSVSAYL
jgi:hypothetical protein